MSSQPLSTLSPSAVTRREPAPSSPKAKKVRRHEMDIYGIGGTWGWLAALVLWFIVFTVIFWLIFYSLHPSFVLQNGSDQVDTAKVLLAAVIASLILLVIIWLIKVFITRAY